MKVNKMLVENLSFYTGSGNGKFQEEQLVDLGRRLGDMTLSGANDVVFEGYKLNLRSMISELKLLEVPSVFICPISLDSMVDPVTLCTGQTYERSNIRKWLSLGHVTCPTTMQELWDDTLTPNRTLQLLIHSWFSQKFLAMKKSEDVEERLSQLLDTLKHVKGQTRVNTLKEVGQVLSKHGIPAKKVIETNGGVVLIISLLGHFTTHAVASEVVGILTNLDLELPSRKNLMQPSKFSLVVDTLNEGSIDTKINCIRLIEKLIEGEHFDSGNSPSLSLIVGLLRIIRDRKHQNGAFAGLALIKTLCSHESVRASLVGIGAVPQLVDSLPFLNNECLAMALHIIETILGTLEGRLALKNCTNAIPTLVKLLMTVSEICTRRSLSILWALIKLAPDESGALAVEAGLAARLLLVMQSSCSPMAKQLSSELLKLCCLNYSAAFFTSKCKLSKTIL